MGIKYHSLYDLKNDLSHLVDAGEINRPLRSIHDFVERIFTEPLCTSLVFGSKVLDRLCQRIGKANLANIDFTLPKKQESDKSLPAYIYIVTKLQKSGGHSLVIEDFITARPDAQHIILSTELAGKSDVEHLLSRLGGQILLTCESAPKTTYQKRLTWLQKRLLEIHPDKVFLFNHHQDSVAVSAIQPEMGFDSYFYHHGDHHMCLGVFLPHLKHIDTHPMGYQTCRSLGIINSYLPLTMMDKGARPKEWSFLKDNKLTTCTAARYNKIEVPYFINYLDIVPQILKTTAGQHIHIGRLSPWGLNRIRRGLKRSGIEQKRFLYTPWVPSVWNALHEYRVDLYVASFPYGGGLTLIEAMGAGVPIALHNHIYSRLLSGIDLAYPEAFRWRLPSELLDFLSKLSPEFLESESHAARLNYLKFHRMEIIEDFLRTGDHNKIKPDDIKNTYSTESDEWAFWLESQLSFRRLVERGMYRIFRMVRNRLH